MIVPFRKSIPARRIAIPSVTNYKDYEGYLKEDFNQKCGYCDDKYTWRTIWYEIDHFVPQKRFLIVIQLIIII